MRLFLHSVDRDIEVLEELDASKSILDRLRGMQDTVRSSWAIIISNDKKDTPNTIESYLNLNVEVNDAYNQIVIERSDYLLDNDLDQAEPIDEYILGELFLSYTIFLDAYNSAGLYYVLCANFPLHEMGHFVEQRQMRKANKLLDDSNE